MLRLLKNNTNPVLVLFLILFLLAVLMLPSNPVKNLPGQDNGVFLYGGQQLLDGRVPYVDFWDHKGPLIFYINALGLFLGSGSRWGVWIVEYLFLLFTAIGLSGIAYKNWSIFSSLIALLLWFYFMKSVGPYYRFGDSNFVETYGLLFNVWAVLIWKFSETWKNRLLGYFFIGCLAGLSFSLRPNNVAVYFALGLIEIVDCYRKRRITDGFIRLGIMLLGVFLIFAVILVWFENHKALPQLFDAVFTYNLAYSDKNFGIASALSVLEYGMIRLYWLPLIGWIGLLLKLIYFSKDLKSKFPEGKVFFSFLLVWSLIEVVFSIVSGRALLHYYINWTVFTTLLVTSLFSSFSSYFLLVESTRFWFSKLSRYFAWILSFMFILVNLSHLRQGWEIANYIAKHRRSEPPRALIESIRSSTNEDDRVLVWGNDVWINFLTDRRSPTKFSYQYPLFMKGYTSKALIYAFLHDLLTCPPIYIVEPVVNTDEILPLSRNRRNGVDSALQEPPGLSEVYAFFDANYRFVWDFNDVNVYKWIGVISENISCR